MEKFKKVQVLLLPTRDYSTLSKAYIANPSYLRYSKTGFEDNAFRSNDNHHLYFLSDEDIEEGDWFIGLQDRIMRATSGDIYGGYERKIIATTDTSLKLETIEYYGMSSFKGISVLPQPSQQFLEEYVEAYNKGEVITEALIEYEDIKVKVGQYAYLDTDQLKVNPDNTIIIEDSAKQNWNREEVKDLVTKAFKAGYERSHSGYPDTDNHTKPNIDKFIEQNL